MKYKVSVEVTFGVGLDLTRGHGMIAILQQSAMQIASLAGLIGDGTPQIKIMLTDGVSERIDIDPFRDYAEQPLDTND